MLAVSRPKLPVGWAGAYKYFTGVLSLLRYSGGSSRSLDKPISRPRTNSVEGSSMSSELGYSRLLALSYLAIAV